MIVTCVRTRGSELSDHQRGRFTSFDSDYSLTYGAHYVVLGMGIWETVAQVLVREDNGLPSWCPLALFDCAPQPLPAHWEFTLCDGINASGTALWTHWVAQWGYPQLIRDPAQSDALMERDPEAMYAFAAASRHRGGPLR